MAVEPGTMDYEAEAVARVQSQDQGDERFKAMVRAVVAPFSELDGLLDQITAIFDYANSTGVSLDKVGDIVGQPRLLPNGNVASDAEYRILIGARIARNVCKTTGEGIITVLNILFGVKIQLIDFGGMALQYSSVGRRPPTRWRSSRARTISCRARWAC
jgi:hypothetical protein